MLGTTTECSEGFTRFVTATRRGRSQCCPHFGEEQMEVRCSPETHSQGCSGARVPRLPGVSLQKRAPAVSGRTVVAIVT